MTTTPPTRSGAPPTCSTCSPRSSGVWIPAECSARNALPVGSAATAAPNSPSPTGSAHCSTRTCHLQPRSASSTSKKNSPARTAASPRCRTPMANRTLCHDCEAGSGCRGHQRWSSQVLSSQTQPLRRPCGALLNGVLHGDQVVCVHHLAAQLDGQVAGGSADQCGQLDGVVAHDPPRHHATPRVDQLHHVAGLEVTVDAGDPGGQ